jgi:glycosyltransferase involved in cell wall biosynthesis
MSHDDGRPSRTGGGQLLDEASLPLVIAHFCREEGSGRGQGGAYTHVRQLRQYLEERGTATTLVTPFSWGRPLTVPVFGPRLVLQRFSEPAGAVWYRHWHEVFLRNALRKCLAAVGDCVVYAQGTLEARAALRACRGPHQRVVMAVHAGTSEADEWAYNKQIKQDGILFRAMRRVEREVIPQVDGLMYVSQRARSGLLSWLPEAGAVPSAVIHDFVAPLPVEPGLEPLGDLVTVGQLSPLKNHRFLLEVLAEAKRAGRSLTLDLYGNGPCLNDLVRQTRSLGLEGQVRFCGFQSDVRRFLPGYRAYVHSSLFESLSLAIIEAMAAGLPIVAASVGGIPEVCDDGVEARFWSLGDPAQAAATLIDLLDWEPARLAAASAARERFRRDFDADVVGPRLWSFLQTLTLPASGALLSSPESANASTTRADVP